MLPRSRTVIVDAVVLMRGSSQRRARPRQTPLAMCGRVCGPRRRERPLPRGRGPSCAPSPVQLRSLRDPRRRVQRTHHVLPEHSFGACDQPAAHVFGPRGRLHMPRGYPKPPQIKESPLLSEAAAQALPRPARSSTPAPRETSAGWVKGLLLAALLPCDSDCAQQVRPPSSPIGGNLVDLDRRASEPTVGDVSHVDQGIPDTGNLEG